ncbi:hypothetical protein GCM10022224_006930 [Nonomuraea antimicrobica]|uniref:Sec-independent protein translocase protein TatB n=1 Tax=Nonomuraea antimicrobica TaxID=561173 RepID=A0ABP7B2K0_9ACTN
MKDSIRVALAIIAGYYLGRRHKLRLATALVAAGVAGKMRRQGGGGLLEQGMKALGTSPEIENIVGRLRGDLMEVGKAAAVAATSKQIDTLSSKLHDRAESLRAPSVPRQRTGEEGEKETHEKYAREERYEEEAPEQKPSRGRMREEAVKTLRESRLAGRTRR